MKRIRNFCRDLLAHFLPIFPQTYDLPRDYLDIVNWADLENKGGPVMNPFPNLPPPAYAPTLDKRLVGAPGPKPALTPRAVFLRAHTPPGGSTTWTVVVRRGQRKRDETLFEVNAPDRTAAGALYFALTACGLHGGGHE